MSKEMTREWLSTQATSSFSHTAIHTSWVMVRRSSRWTTGKNCNGFCLKVSRFGGGGEITKFVCGYMVCEPQLSQIFLNGLPSLMKVNIRNDASGQWLENSIREGLFDHLI